MSLSTDSQSLSRLLKPSKPWRREITTPTVNTLERFLTTLPDPEKNSKLKEHLPTLTEKWLPRLPQDSFPPLPLDLSTSKTFYSAFTKLMVPLWFSNKPLKLLSKLTRTRASKKPSLELLKHLVSFKNSRKQSQFANPLTQPRWTGPCSTKLFQPSRTQSSTSMSSPKILS